MRLSDLKPEYWQYVSETEQHAVIKKDDANGIMFLCPECTRRKLNGEKIHVHSILCWNPSVPQTILPIPGRWNILGDNFEDLTLQNGSSSVALTGACNAHFCIKNGEIIFC
jgi:hypothetical protein